MVRQQEERMPVANHESHTAFFFFLLFFFFFFFLWRQWQGIAIAGHSSYRG